MLMLRNKSDNKKKRKNNVNLRHLVDIFYFSRIYFLLSFLFPSFFSFLQKNMNGSHIGEVSFLAVIAGDAAGNSPVFLSRRDSLVSDGSKKKIDCRRRLKFLRP